MMFLVKAGIALLVFSGGSGLAPEEQALLQSISDAGRCALADSADQRVSVQPSISPGAPPLLSFRLYEGKMHHRFGNAELMLDDAGH